MAHIGNLIVGPQKFVLFKDHVSVEKYSSAIIDNILKSQNETNIVTNTIPGSEVSLCGAKQRLLDVNLPSAKSVIVLPPASHLFQKYLASDIFKMLQKLKNSPEVKQIYLWLTVANFPEHDHIPEFIEHMANVVVRLETKSELELLIRKTSGSVTRKQYNYELKDHLLCTEIKKKKEVPVPDTPVVKPESLGTFKIELSEKDKIARSNLVLPFEKHLKIGEPPSQSPQPGGKIIYDLDKEDDFDEEDPDDDLDI